MQRLSTVIRITLAIAFVVAMGINVINEIDTVPELGWRFGGVPILSALYWHSLVLLDPVVATLLLVRPRTGLVAAGVVLVTGIAHNTWFMFAYREPVNVFYWLSLGLLAFYLVTLVPAWRGANGRAPERPVNAPESAA